MKVTPVLVEATDWCSYFDCQHLSSEEFSTIDAQIVGNLLAEDKDKLVLAMQTFEDNGVRGILAIPKSCVKKIRRLR